METKKNIGLRDVLRDVVDTTSPFGFENIAFKREDGFIAIEGYTIDRQVIMKARTKQDVTDIKSTFGLGNLPMLQGLLNLKTFQSDSTVIEPYGTKTDKEGKVTIDGLCFRSDDAEMKFVVQAEKYIARQPKTMAIDFEAQITPSAAKVVELKSLAGVIKSISALVTPYTEDNSLFFRFGAPNSNNHNGALNFMACKGELKGTFSFPVERIMQALTRINNSEITMEFSERSLIRVTVDTGVVIYEFLLTGG